MKQVRAANTHAPYQAQSTMAIMSDYIDEISTYINIHTCMYMRTCAYVDVLSFCNHGLEVHSALAALSPATRYRRGLQGRSAIRAGKIMNPHARKMSGRDARDCKIAKQSNPLRVLASPAD